MPIGSDRYVHFTYDANLRVTAIDARTTSGSTANQPATYQYDTDSLLTQLNFGGRTVAYTRHPGNGLLQSASVGSLAETWSHNGFAEPTGYSVVWGTSPRLSFAYTRDKLGRITQVQEDGSRTTGYAYDLAGRLIRVTRNGEQIAEYGYDANSNRITATYAASLASALTACAPNTGPLTADVDAQDRMTRYGTCVYAYGANGERAQKTDTATGHITAYQYDEFGNLRQANLPDGRTISYGIDGLNRRVTKSIDGQLQGSWLYKDALEPIAELDAAGNFVSLFAYGEKPHVPSLMRKGSTTYKIVSDHLGSVRQVINLSTGAVVQALDYDAWGNVLQDTNPGFQPFGFAGGLYDRDTGLVRFGARDYDPVSGRWTAKDPIGFGGGDSNIYGYVGGDPINRYDLNGFESEIIFWSPLLHPGSLFGHVSTNIDGENFSFGPGGWDRQRQNAEDYIARQNELGRTGLGHRLDLTDDQESQFKQCMTDLKLTQTGDDYNSMLYNCTSGAQQCLFNAGVPLPDLSILPGSFQQTLGDSGVVGGINWHKPR